MFSITRDAMSLQRAEVGENPQISDQPSGLKLLDMIPSNLKQKYSSFMLLEVFGVEDHSSLFIHILAQPQKEFAQKIIQGKIISESMFFVISLSRSDLTYIDRIPDDLIKGTNLPGSLGKVFAISRDGQLYCLYTQGDAENLNSCVTRLVRW